MFSVPFAVIPATFATTILKCTSSWNIIYVVVKSLSSALNVPLLLLQQPQSCGLLRVLLNSPLCPVTGKWQDVEGWLLNYIVNLACVLGELILVWVKLHWFKESLSLPSEGRQF